MVATPFQQNFTQSRQDYELLQQLEFIPGLKEILLVRQVHALEHATVWVLGGTPKRNPYQAPTKDDDRYGGMSTAEGFYLTGEVEIAALRHAAHKALHRLTHGETHLAVHPRCGTNVSVALGLTASLAMGAHLLLPKDPISQFFGLGAALTVSTQLTPIIGDWMQANVTTALPFNLIIQDIQRVPSQHGRPLHFVQTQWRDWS
jgi:hypothetical protein